MTPLKLLKRTLWAPLAGMALFAMSAHAAPTQGPNGLAFYTPPSPLPAGDHGDLIWYRSTTVAPPGAPATDAWNVLYHSIDAVGTPNVVTGTVLVPKSAWSGRGSRPIVGYEVGTHGLAQSCAPSLQLAGGTDYENANIAAALNAGYAVLVTDNPGYTTGDVPTYLAGAAQGHAALDIFKAALQIPSISLSSNADVAIWGYSQGGQTAAWAAELQPSYMPSLNLQGVAAGGVPADFIETADYLNGSAGASFLLAGIIGLGTQYPDQIPYETLSNPTGQAAIARGKTECVFQALFDFLNDDLSQFTVGNQTLHQLETNPDIYNTMVAQDLGNNRIPVPLYQYHGQADEFIPLDQSEALKKAYCKLASNVTFGLYPGEHITTQFQAAPYVLSWLGDRFNGKLTLGNCADMAAAPTSTALPGGGDFIVALDKWPLDASLHLATLDQDVQLPSTSTFSADTNMSANKLTGDLSIPSFVTKIKLAGIPLSVKLSVTETSPTVGTASLDNAGLLHVHGHAYANITIDSLGVSVFRLPFGCTTSSPVDFPVDFDGPISSLGNGNLTFVGTTSFSSFSNKGCAFAALFTALISGPGQTYSYNVSPPAPTSW